MSCKQFKLYKPHIIQGRTNYSSMTAINSITMKHFHQNSTEWYSNTVQYNNTLAQYITI